MDSLKLDKMMNGFIKIIYNKLPGVFRPEGPGYFSPGQSLRRNDGNIAPGEKCVLKTVREEKSIKSELIFRTERQPRNPYKTEFPSFRPKLRLIFEWLYSTDEFNASSSTQGVALGYNNFPFQGIERMESDIRKIYFELKRE